jgi:hypothetical protein
MKEEMGNSATRRKGDVENNKMKKIIALFLSTVALTWAIAHAAPKELEIKGRSLISPKPPFTMNLPSEFRLIHDFSHENPSENSRTRVYLLIKEQDRQVGELFILQIADKTNPQAGPMTAPPLTPYEEKRMYLKDKKKRGELEIDYLLQLMVWNPDAPSLQPIRKKGINIPSHWALQGQFIFIYQGEHAVFIRYSKDVNAFGVKFSEKGKDWEKGSISGNEKKVYEAFKKSFMEMVDSIQIRNP